MRSAKEVHVARVQWCRRVAGASLVFLLGVLAAGCDRGEQSSTPATQSAGAASGSAERGTIGVSVLTLANPFFKEMADTLTAEAQKHGYAVRVVSSEMDAARQREQVKDFLV